jgi:hypothetical protein
MVIRPEAGEEHISVHRPADGHQTGGRRMLYPVRMKQEKDSILLLNSSVFIDLLRIVRPEDRLRLPSDRRSSLNHTDPEAGEELRAL